MYVYRVEWHFFINVACKLHHNPESRNSLDGKFAKHSRVYKWHSLKFSLKRAKILNFTYSKVQTMFKAKDFV